MKRKKLLLGLVMLIPIIFMKVEAKSFTINELVGKFNDIGTIQASTYGKMAATIDSDNKKINVVADKENASLDYTDNYILFDNSKNVPTDDGSSAAMFDFILFHNFLNAILNLTGIDKDYTVNTIDNYTSDYDKYNVEIVYKNYKYTVNTDSGTEEKESTYLNDFKIGFDSDKIRAFAAAYGKETDAKKYGNLAPKLEMYVAEGIPYYKLSLEYTPKDESDKPYCKVYRSETIDGNYVKLGAENWSIGCNDFENGIAFGDDEAKAGKTYYYKAQVTGSDKFSNILKVNLTSNIITDTSNNEIIYAPSKDNDKEDKTDDKTTTNDKKEEPKKDYKNPETGDFLPLLPILILILASIGVWHKVKDKFVRI